MQKTRTGWFVPGMAGIGVGMVIGVACVAPSIAREAPRVQAEGNPQERTLDANLYMQTSAEYRAACLQTYSWATERLRARVAAMPGGAKTPAIVMDLDETVIDNSGYQSFLDREKLSFTDPTWEVWERDFPQEVRLIPGAKPFIEAAEQMGVTVIYISNRAAKNQAGTVAALKNVGLNTEDLANRLLLKEQTSDKTARREIAEKKHTVLMYPKSSSLPACLPRTTPDRKRRFWSVTPASKRRNIAGATIGSFFPIRSTESGSAFSAAIHTLNCAPPE
jgi:5'-nucleotidase (lipoprotein e(P4) family)